MHLVYEPEAAWCIVKSVTVKTINGLEICKLPFGTQLLVLHSEDERDNLEVYSNRFHGAGYVPIASLSFDPIVDMARLPFYNSRPYAVPVSMRFNGHRTGMIKPDEVVSVIVATGEWYLTSKGWTKAKWLKKKVDIDQGTMRDIALAVVHRTVNDYRIVINKLRGGKYRGADEYIDLVNEMDLLRDWFTNGSYKVMLTDRITGEERLEMIDKSMEITDNWIKTHHAKRDALISRKSVNK